MLGVALKNFFVFVNPGVTTYFSQFDLVVRPALTNTYNINNEYTKTFYSKDYSVVFLLNFKTNKSEYFDLHFEPWKGNSTVRYKFGEKTILLHYFSFNFILMELILK